MKKSKLILIFAMALGLAFNSCTKDDDPIIPVDQSPIINFIGGGTYISADATVTAGEDFVIGIIAASNTDSQKDLISVKYTITSNNVIVLEHDSAFSESNYNVDYTFKMLNAGEAVFKFEVTDKNGEKASVSLTIIAEAATTPLGTEEDLYWERVANASATGLEAYGLKWENNLKEYHAVISKDSADKFVQLTSEEWTSILTQEDLIAAIAANTDLIDYRVISAETPATYDEVLATSHNGEYFLIHLTSSEITVGTNGTTIKIFGESKK